MSLNPYNPRAGRVNPFLTLAAAAGGSAARAAVDRAANWLVSPRQPYNMQAMVQALPRPSNANARGRGQRGRGRGRGRRPQVVNRPGGQPSAGTQTRSGANIILQDTEILGAVKAGSLAVYAFNPAPKELTRLYTHSKMYRRYKIFYMNISYKPGVGTATDNNIAMGIAVGPRIASVKDQDTVVKLRPMAYCPGWKAFNLTVGSDIDLSRYMLCGDETADGIAFCLYVFGTAQSGLIQISYKVELSHPIPF